MIREFLYVDVVRVRSMLAQLDSGIVETVVSKQTNQTTRSFGASILGLTAEGSAERIADIEESRTTHDLLFSIFEEAVESEQIMQSVTPEEISDPDRWGSGDVQSDLLEGQILKLFTPVMILDPAFLHARLDRFVALTNALAAMNEGQIEKAMAELETPLRAEMDATLAGGTGNREQRGHQKRAAEKALKGFLKSARDAMEAQAISEASPEILNVIDLVKKFVSADALSVRFLACGEEQPQLSFSGALLGRSEYIQDEREALFSRYGSVLKGWTSIVQVAVLPRKEDADIARERDFGSVQVASDDAINRAAMEQTLVQLVGMMEARGIAEGPLWPGISVIPLGIYRVVPLSEQAQPGIPTKST